MALLGIDLGGTKLALAVLSEEGHILEKEVVRLEGRKGAEVGRLISEATGAVVERYKSGTDKIFSIGISVPGISHVATGTVWAPNIPGWEDYPLLEQVRSVCGDIPVTIDSDRACYILGEAWLGNAKGCSDAIFLSVGTGIGAGILVNGEILRGRHDIAGCIGWMALQRPYDEKYRSCGCFEYNASGEGITKVAKDYIADHEYHGPLKHNGRDSMNTSDVFEAYRQGDPVAVQVINDCINFWGMAVANLVSLFNPEKIIFGGGVFGPATSLVAAIRLEAEKWAQPVGMSKVTLDVSSLGGDAGITGAAFLAMKKFKNS
jgi:glucokinase